MRLIEGEVMQGDFCDSEHGADQVVRTQEIHPNRAIRVKSSSKIDRKATVLSSSR